MPTATAATLTPAAQVDQDAADRKANHSMRIGAYKTFLSAYFGGDDDAHLAILGSNADGRPVLRLQRNNDGGDSIRRGAPNILSPMIDDMVSLRGTVPKLTVPAKSSAPADRQAATKLSRALRQQWEQSRMTNQQPEAAFYLSCLGDVCYTIDPRTPQDVKDDEDPFRPAGIYITVNAPINAFPRFRFGHNARELEDLYLIWMMPADAIRDTYGIELADGKEHAQVVHFYSRTEKQVVVDGRRVSGVLHNLGFCPAQWCSNKATDGRYAQADIRNAVDLHTEMQAMFQVYCDALVWAVYPIVHIKNRHNIRGDAVEVGPGATIETISDGDVTMVAPAANPQAARLIFDATVDNLMQIVGVAPVRLDGQIDKANVSGRSVQQQMSPMEQRVSMSNTILGDCLQTINSKLMLMLWKIPEMKNAEFELYGQDQDGIYNETFTGEDVGGWTRNNVKWDSLMGSSTYERTVRVLQLYKEGRGKFPFRRVIEEAGEDDPQAIMAEGVAEAEEDMKRQQQMQGAMAPPGGGGPAGPPTSGGPPSPGGGGAQAAAHDAMSLSAGGSGGPMGGGPGAATPAPVQPQPPDVSQPPPPTMPGFGPVASAPTSPGMGHPAPLPDFGKEIDSVLHHLQLQGTIVQSYPTKQGVHVDVTDHRDVHAVKVALAPVAKEIAGPTGKVDVKIQKG